VGRLERRVVALGHLLRHQSLLQLVRVVLIVPRHPSCPVFLGLGVYRWVRLCAFARILLISCGAGARKSVRCFAGGGDADQPGPMLLRWWFALEGVLLEVLCLM
jgi:hypothetical protein